MCQNQQEFVVPDHLIKQLASRNAVIFAGAGVSTETPTVFPWSFYEEIHEALGLSEEDKPAFPKLMSLFCERPDGRRQLLERIRARLSYVRSFPELYRTATRLHRELSTLFYVDTYFTTNWDDYFERECGATPFVNGGDFAFWDTRGRKVFKLHGSVSNFGSVVATDADYRRAQKQLQRGIIGAALKVMLATKTIVYVGYSFSDSDFLSVHRYISRELKQIAPIAYIVSLDRSAEARFRALGLTPIFTDAAHFVQVLKKHFEADGHSLPDSKLDAIPFALARARIEHDRLHETFEVIAKPEIIYCASYQDGLIHAFERILSRSHAGDYSHQCQVAEQLRKYDSIRAENLRARRYWDVAYVEGYMNGLMYLLADGDARAKLPFYFIYGLEGQPVTLAEYKKALKTSAIPHKRAKALAERIVREKLGPGDDLHHTPFLTWKAESE
jgi:SIR2-like domain